MNSGDIKKNIKWVLLAIFIVEMVLVLSGLLSPEDRVGIVGVRG
ncbi:MAG: hypothetical protein Q4A93_06920 [Actinomycetota bacterium]|nr:hypothetical protein [Actinomycetota bacterium]